MCRTDDFTNCNYMMLERVDWLLYYERDLGTHFYSLQNLEKVPTLECVDFSQCENKVTGL
jgi:hypothetical protein